MASSFNIVFDLDFANLPDLGDSKGPVSYAGRKNQNQNVYPGIFNPGEGTTTTPVMSDDIGEPNHKLEYRNFFFIKKTHNRSNFLFLDGHVDHPFPKEEYDLEAMFDVLAN